MKVDLIEQTKSVALADKARELKKSGFSIIELQTGDPYFSTHPDIVAASHNALLAGYTHYSYSSGLIELKDCIANEINTEFNTGLLSKNILITQGAVQGIFATLMALVELYDEVIILEPNWTTIDSIVTTCGGRPIKISHLVEDDELFYTLDKYLSQKTKIVYINSPNNPTGSVFSVDRIQRLVDWCRKHNLYLLSDEVYRFIVFDSPHESALDHFNHNEKIIFIDSFSKKYAMTGWRIGFVIAHENVMLKIAKSSQIQITHVAPFVQYGALEAMRNNNVKNYVNTMFMEYSERRRRLINLCSQLGLKIITPQGAFYLFVYTGVDDQTYSEKLLHEHGICVIPGSAYGASGRNYIRITFSAEISLVSKALNVISRTLQYK